MHIKKFFSKHRNNTFNKLQYIFLLSFESRERPITRYAMMNLLLDALGH